MNFNTTNGLISGTPSLAGDYQVMLTASNAVGVGASIVDITIFDTGSSVVREIWTGVPGTNITDIPTGTPANITNAFGALEGVTDYGDNYGERVRGYFTAPATGNYYFWIAGSDSAQLWISDDSEPVNKVLRAWVTPTNNPAPPPPNGTASRQWNVQSSQQSDWLTLVAGQKYYLEILHKAGDRRGRQLVGRLAAGPDRHEHHARRRRSQLSAVALLPAAAGEHSGHALFREHARAAGRQQRWPSARRRLRVSADGTQAILNFSINNLVGTPSGEHINSDPYLSNPEPAPVRHLRREAAAGRQLSLEDQSRPGPLTSVADILEIINEGKAYINI